MATLVLVRHAESVHNQAMAAYRAHGDASLFTPEYLALSDRAWPITQLGNEQAAAAREWLRENMPDFRCRHLLVSPYRRTRETAELLQTGLEPMLDERLREQDWGRLNRLHPTHPDREDEVSVNRRYALDFDCIPSEGGESLAAMKRERTDPFLAEHLSSHQDCDDIIVTHGGTIRCLRMRLEGIPDEGHPAAYADSRFRSGNCQIVIYTDTDPRTGQKAGRLSWVRSVRLGDPTGGHGWYCF